MATAQRDAKPVTFGVTILCRWLPVNNRKQHLEQIEKLLTSRTLHGSESLCKLLRYLADHSVDHPGASPKEYQIATEVFGRQQDFDPHVDSMVRVQAGRLRTKLAERSEERRVGKECRSRWWPYHEKKKRDKVKRAV